MITSDIIEVKYQDTAHVFSTFKEVNNTVIIPVTAKISIYNSVDEILIDDVDMVIGGLGVCTYSWDASGQAIGQNYYVKYTLDSYDPVIRFFDIYIYPFGNNVTDDDLKSENSIIKEGVWEFSGKAENGTITTIVDNDLIGNDETWTGGLVEIYQNDNIHQRKVTSFNSVNGTITFSPAMDTALTTEAYVLRRSYQEQIDIAGVHVQLHFRKIEKRAYLVIDHVQLKWLIIYKFFENFFQQLRNEKDDRYDIQYKYYAGKYNAEFESLSLIYDEDKSGTVDDDEVNQNVGEIKWYR